MTLLDQLAPDVDIDAAFMAFRRVSERRSRRRQVIRLGTASVAVVLIIGAALLTASAIPERRTGGTAANPTTTSGGQAPAAWPTAQAAIAGYLGAHLTVRERARVRFDANKWVLIAEGVPGFDRASVWTVSALDFQHGTHGWTQTGSGGAGMLDHCFTGLLGAGFPTTPANGKPPTHVEPDYVYAATADPTWNIQALINGHWAPLPTAGGVYFNAKWGLGPTPSPGEDFHVPLRPVTPDGHLPPCFTEKHPELVTPSKAETQRNNPFIGNWHVHGAQLSITPDAGTVSSNCGGAVCTETDQLAISRSPDGQTLTAVITAITYTNAAGQAIPNPNPNDSQAIGDSFDLTFVAQHLMSETSIRTSLPAIDQQGSNPYWCGTGLASSLNFLCGA